jgi:hypothetical protein
VGGPQRGPTGISIDISGDSPKARFSCFGDECQWLGLRVKLPLNSNDTLSFYVGPDESSHRLLRQTREWGGILNLHRRRRHRRINKSAPLTKRLVLHRYLLRDEVDLDSVFAGWLKEGLAVGNGEDL